MARLCAPLLAALGASLLMSSPPGQGAGFIAGLCVGLGVVAHALAFGVAATRALFAPVALRIALACGLLLFSLAPLFDSAWVLRMQEAAGFVVTSACLALATMALFGRVPTLRDDPW
jgi:multisubunit Na+/H+ antiporter MnhB subunit